MRRENDQSGGEIPEILVSDSFQSFRRQHLKKIPKLKKVSTVEESINSCFEPVKFPKQEMETNFSSYNNHLEESCTIIESNIESSTKASTDCSLIASKVTPIPDFQTFCEFPASFFSSLSNGLWPLYDHSSDTSQCSSNSDDQSIKSSQGVQSIKSSCKNRSGLPKRRMEANARERDRTMSVNSAFKILRSLIPTEPPNRKLSKIETLRLATSYINHLNNVRKAVAVGDSGENACARSSGELIQRQESEKRSSRTNVCTFCITSSKRRLPQNCNLNSYHWRQ